MICFQFFFLFFLAPRSSPPHLLTSSPSSLTKKRGEKKNPICRCRAMPPFETEQTVLIASPSAHTTMINICGCIVLTFLASASAIILAFVIPTTTNDLNFCGPTVPINATLVCPTCACSVRFFWSDTQAPKVHHYNLQCILTAGSMFVPGDIAFAPQFPGYFATTGNDTCRINDNEWVEVMHFSRREDHSRREDTATAGQFWYYAAPGSGILFNVGRALRMSSAGRWSPGCAYAAQQGYDSIILSVDNRGLPEGDVFYGGLVEIVDCAGARLNTSLLDLPWTGPCPFADTAKLMHNVPMVPCNCSDLVTYLNCYA